MARRKQRARVHGPYHHRQRWRIIIVGEGGEKDYESYETKGEAQKVKRALEKMLYAEERTMADALTAYGRYLIDDKGNRERSVKTTMYRLNGFFGDCEVSLARISPRTGQALYDELRARVTVDSHRNALAEAKTFFHFCVDQKWLKASPLEGVRGVGRRQKGKAQLRIDEARKWREVAHQLAGNGDTGAVAAMMTLLMGLRASEVTERIVRDVDDDGRVLWVTASKTEAGKRRVAIPADLRPLLLKLVDGREPGALVFGKHDRGWPRKCVKRICLKAGVPEVSAHGMRGLHGTLSTSAGETSHAVARALGHESTTTTHDHYIERSASDEANQRQVLRVLAGGRR